MKLSDILGEAKVGDWSDYWSNYNKIEDLHPERRAAITRREEERARATKKTQAVGAGAAAYVHAPTDERQLNKVHRVTHQGEATAVYLNKIAKSRIASANPFFPKVYATRTKSGTVTHTIERLVPFNTIAKNTELLESLREQYFDRDLMYRAAPEDFVNAIRLVFRKPEYAKDPMLKQAVEFIIHLKQELKDRGQEATVDIHVGNIMWRLTGNIPQLVITDPIHVPTISW